MVWFFKDVGGRVAHSGGVYLDKKYTNSLEAMQQSVSNGYTHIELDFVFTSDEKLVCLHDWEESFEYHFDRPSKGRVLLEQFNQLVTEAPYKNCNLNTLHRFLENNTHVVVITDIKERNIEGLRQIFEYFKDANNRFIPQIYGIHEYDIARSIGFDRIIWTLYKDNSSYQDIYLNSISRDLYAVTLDYPRARSYIAWKLRSNGVHTYVHTINDLYRLFALKFIYGVNEVYTDELAPSVVSRVVNRIGLNAGR